MINPEERTAIKMIGNLKTSPKKSYQFEHPQDATSVFASKALELASETVPEELKFDGKKETYFYDIPIN